MAIPSRKRIQLPLLQEIEAVGGEVALPLPRDFLGKVVKHFPDFDPTARYPCGSLKWPPRVKWAGKELIHKGELDASTRGWRISERGRERLLKEQDKTMAEKVKSAEEATEIALSFLNKHYRFIHKQPTKAVREDNVWLVEIDVGLLLTRIAKLKIDAKTATILEYTISPEVV